MWLVALVVTLLAIVAGFFFLSKRKAAKKDLVILCGLCGSGKTALLSLLKDGKKRETVTSMKENLEKIEFDESSIEVLDFPGHEKARHELLAKYVRRAKCILFLIDSVEFPLQKQQVASYLYSLLTNKEISDAETNILIVCNKQDLLPARKKEEIKVDLLQELDQIRATRAAAPRMGNEEEKEITQLGYANKKLEYGHLSSDVQFTNASVARKEVAEIRKFIQENL